MGKDKAVILFFVVFAFFSIFASPARADTVITWTFSGDSLITNALDATAGGPPNFNKTTTSSISGSFSVN